MIETTYSLTEGEYIESQLLYLRHKQKRFRRMRIALVVILSLSFLSLLLGPATIDPKAPGLYFVVPLFLLMLFYPLLERHGLRKRYVIEQDNFKGVSLQIDEHALRSNIPRIGHAEIEWSAYSLLIENPRLYVLIRNLTFFPIPKRALLAGQIEALDGLLQRSMPQAERVRILK